MADLEEASVKQLILSGNDIYFPRQTTSNSKAFGIRTAIWFSHRRYISYLALKAPSWCPYYGPFTVSGEAGFSVVDTITLHTVRGDWWWTAAQIKPVVSRSPVGLFNCCLINSLSQLSLKSLKSLVLKICSFKKKLPMRCEASLFFFMKNKNIDLTLLHKKARVYSHADGSVRLYIVLCFSDNDNDSLLWEGKMFT